MPYELSQPLRDFNQLFYYSLSHTRIIAISFLTTDIFLSQTIHAPKVNLGETKEVSLFEGAKHSRFSQESSFYLSSYFFSK